MGQSSFPTKIVTKFDKRRKSFTKALDNILHNFYSVHVVAKQAMASNAILNQSKTDLAIVKSR